jgi:2-polyprenyl-3-methyl-5-hydroxy-6-metoxy-1,4-benzoquinol methylase
MSQLLSLARVGLKGLRWTVSRIGYDVIPAPRSTNPQSTAVTAKIAGGSVNPGRTALASRALRSFPASDDARVTPLYQDIRSKVVGLDGSTFDFPVIDGAEKGLKSSRDRILWYVNPLRVRGYLTCLDFVDACGVDLKGATVLDLGTGAGVLPYLVSRHYERVEVLGIDLSEKYVALAQALFPTVKYRQANLDHFDLSSSYDCVFCTQTLEHMAFPGDAVRKLVTLVRPGGHLILTVPDGRSDTSPSNMLHAESESYNGHVNFWSIESWASFLQENLSIAALEVAITDRNCLYACITVA